MLSIFDNPEFDHHEQVVFCHDEKTGLRAIIAVHDTTLGPAAGGCRMWPYDSVDAALTDVLRLSRAMSYKNALADLPLGGGKSVIIGNPRTDKTPALLQAFATQVQHLGGRYHVAEDIGIGMDDVEVFAQQTTYVFGLQSKGAATGDPSPFTARGAFEGMRAAVIQRLKKDGMDGLRVAVQGVGNVGRQLCKLLHKAGAKLIVTDVNADASQHVAEQYGAAIVGTEEIYAQDVEVFSPCAMGAVINDATIPQLRASIIAGVANNQLAEPRHGTVLHERNILYAPDYVVNAGGMLNATGDIFGRYDVDDVMRRILKIYDTTREIFEESAAKNQPTSAIADELARAKIQAGKSQM